jgi:2-dehydro-3-deoxygluconokinase
VSGRTGDAPALVTIGEGLGSLASTEFGPLGHSRTLRLRTAGAEANVAIGASRMGATALWAGRVGSDPVGDLILRELAAEGVQVHAARDSSPTAIMLKECRTTELTKVHYWREGSAGSNLSESDVPEAAIRTAGIVHLTGVTAALSSSARRALWKAIEVARGHGVPVSFDINFRSRLWSDTEAIPVLRDLVKHSDVLFAGEEEAALLSAESGPAAMRELSGLGPTTVLLKRGAKGSSALVDGEVLEAPVLPVRVVDPVGAGDAFAAGFLAATLQGLPVRRRLETAAVLGSVAVSTDGDWEGLPHREELPSFLELDSVQR